MMLVVNEEREELATVIRSVSVQSPVDGMKHAYERLQRGLEVESCGV